MDGLDHPIFQFFMQLAYEPVYAYAAISALLIASSFGLPFPEEITLLSAGFLSHISLNPEIYPPPSPDSIGVNAWVTAFVCFAAVLGSDVLVFSLGRHFGPRLLKHRLTSRILTPQSLEKITRWTERFGPLACGVFRFTPGLRFPGHFACGSFGISYAQFLAIDGMAALLTVPTQVILMAFYGQEILGILKNVKIVLAVVIITGLSWYFWRRHQHAKKSAATATPKCSTERCEDKHSHSA